MYNNLNYTKMRNIDYYETNNLSNKKKLTKFDRRVMAIRQRGLDLIDNFQMLLDDLGLSQELHPMRFKIKEYELLNMMSGSSYIDLKRVSSFKNGKVYQDLEGINELFRVTDMYNSSYGLDETSPLQGLTYVDDRAMIFDHLNDSYSYSTFVRRLHVLSSYIDKGLQRNYGDGGLSRETYKNNIRLIRYDFVRYH